MEKLVYKKISSQEQYEEYCNIIKELMLSDNINSETSSHMELLSLLIKTWDEEQYNEMDYDPVTLIESLMKEHNLKQVDIARICNTGTSYISEIMNYKKTISPNVVRKLSEFFCIRQEALNKHYKLRPKPIVLFESNIHQGHFYLESNQVRHTIITHKQKKKDMSLEPNNHKSFGITVEGRC
ncbi:MAG: helix-turn-helix domain-containing protein [Candidatus Paceibacterota bacterium]